MLTFPNCKINLGLHITGKRADGYHDIETIFYPLPLNDALEIITAQPNLLVPSPVSGLRSTVFSSSGLPIPGDASTNLCVKAYELLKADFDNLPPVQMHLHKVIPMGAGLGGGSSDGAFALKLINQLFHLNLSNDQLMIYAAKLGSDCPFFILNQPCFATGRGEILEPFTLNLTPYTFALVHPNIHISTQWAFKQLKPTAPAKSIKTIVQQPIETWRQELVNDFELPIAKAYPAIAQIKEALYNQGALYAAMSGSGSSLLGIFPKNHPINKNHFLPYSIDILG